MAATLAVSLLAGNAWSQDAKELARARERFKEAAALQAAGDFGRALEAYKEVALVKSTAALRFNIATCEEKLGDYVRAVGSYRLALTEATRSNSKDIEASVQKALAALEPRIPMLLVQRGEGAAVAEVFLDGRALGNPSIGVEIQANPGPHTLKAIAADRLPSTVEINLADGEHKTVKLVLKPKPVAAPVVVAPPPVEPPPDVPPPKGNKSMRIAGFVVGGVGLVSLGVSAGFFAMRQKAISDLDAECGPTHMTCPASAQSTKDSGAKDATIATAMFVTGLGVAAVGGILIGVSTQVKAPKPKAGLVLLPGGAGLRGTF